MTSRSTSRDVVPDQRVAFFATDVFLRLNGWRLTVDATSAHAFLIGRLEQGECGFDHLLPWIRESMTAPE